MGEEVSADQLRANVELVEFWVLGLRKRLEKHLSAVVVPIDRLSLGK